MKTYSRRRIKSDYVLSLLIFGLVLFGLIAIYSVSKYYSLQITDSATDKYYLTRQIIWVIVGLVAWIFFQAIDYRVWQKYSRYMLFLTLGLLILPVFVGATQGESASRWIGLGFASFQPAELAKLTMIIYLAGLFSHKKYEANPDSVAWPFYTFILFVSFIMLVQKDLGSLGVIVGIAASMFLMSGIAYRFLFYGGAMAGILVWIAIKLEPYRMERFLTFLNPENDLLGSGYHIRNALIAVGSGGLWGLGFGQSKQKYLYLPEAHTDSIFAIVSEELGSIRASLVVIAFGLVAIRGYKIAKNSPDSFSRLLAVGITTWFIWQAFVNIAAMLSIMPLTGVPLPFVSYGGSSLVFLLAAVGILTNISKYSYEK